MRASVRIVLFCIVCCYGSMAHGQTAPQSVTLTVAAQPSQTLEGFGCSMVDLSDAKLPASARAEMFRLVFKGLRMNVLRLWVGSGADRTVSDMKTEFYRTYVDSGIIAEARQQGVSTLLLAPARGEQPPGEPMPDYARKVAEFIRDVKTERKIGIGVTGIANEPGFTPAQMAEAVRVVRRELDARDLQDVRIIAPEAASAEDTGLRLIAGIRADAEAWAALDGIATHSYNMAATPAFPATVAGTRKQYWMTEASDNGNEREDDVDRAASLSGRFLNDLNHGVTHWIFFIGFDGSPDVAMDRDNATKFMVYDLKQQRVFRHLKYDWFRQLRTAFPNGSRIYPLKAEPGDDLTYTYGQKPFLNAAVARRPDGGWSLGIVNLTGIRPDTAISRWYPGAVLNVTVKVPPLAGRGAITLKTFLSNRTRRFVPAADTPMTNGVVNVTLQPGELITLSSR